ncbi:MAG: hypothetical protein Q9217_001788 [Psora testacea]
MSAPRIPPTKSEFGRPLTSSSLFKPINISGLGLVQDGALVHNNPAQLAEWEFRRLWPNLERPDLMVSLGTGTSVPTLRSPAKAGFVLRLWRSFMSLLDGQRAWGEVLNRLDEATLANYFRFNVTLPSEIGAIDDVESMDQMRSIVRSQLETRQVLDTAVALIISSFFFELSAIPIFLRGSYQCQGYILCRLSSKAMKEALVHLGYMSWTFATGNEILGRYQSVIDACQRCSVYRKAVRFRVRHLSDSLSMYMQNHRYRRQISGFPRPIQWFVDQ